MAQRTATLSAILLVFAAAVASLLPAAASADTRGRVVVVGVPGLRWSDVKANATPALWRMTGQGSPGALSTKTVAPNTCPIDGWLTVSAGQRSELRHGACGLPPTPAGGVVPGFAAMRDDNAKNKFGSKLGLLGDQVHEAGGCTLAIGPGAAVGAADSAGRVDDYLPSLTQMTTDRWSKCALGMVDVDDIYRAYISAGVDVNGHQDKVTARRRAAAVRRADDQIARVLGAVPAGTTVLLAGLADNGATPHLHTAIASGPGYGGHYLTADSTRTNGLVTLTDLTSTALKVLGIEQPKDAVGAPWREGSETPASTKAVVRALDGKDAAAQAYAQNNVVFYLALAVAQIALYVFAIFALRRRRSLGVVRVLALAVASLPVATFLANLVPWGRAGHPLPVLVGAVLVAIAVVTGAAMAGPRWITGRRSVTASGAVVGAITALVLTVDTFTGDHLQNCSVFGYTPIVAGRFYGFANTTWALWITGILMAVGAVAGRLDRRSAVILIAVTGVISMAIDVAPMAGADFGGVISLVPGFAVFAFMATGKRISPVKLLGVLAIGGVAILAIAFADAQRAEPTHIGEFWNSLTSGDAGGIIVRKAQAMFRSFGNWKLTVAAIAAVAFLCFALLRPLTLRAALLQRAYERAPALRDTLIAVLVTIGVGMLANDSGVAIPAMALSVAIPLALAAGVRAMELDDGESPPPPREQPAETSAPTS